MSTVRFVPPIHLSPTCTSLDWGRKLERTLVDTENVAHSQKSPLIYSHHVSHELPARLSVPVRVHNTTISFILASLLPNIWEERPRTTAVSVRVSHLPTWIPCLPPFCPALPGWRVCVVFLGRDGLFKAAQAADSKKWNGMYDAWWELTQGDYRFVRTLGRIPATSKLHRPDLLLHPVTSCRRLPQPIDS